MTDDKIRLRVITNNPERAMREEVLGCYLADMPKWCTVITTPEAVAKIPAGARCYSIIYTPPISELKDGRAPLLLLEEAWHERCLYGDLIYLGEKEFAGMRNWRKKHGIASKQEAQAALAKQTGGRIKGERLQA